MTDLERFQAGRDDELVRRFARRIEPTFGFVAYGILWLYVGLIAGVAVAFALAYPAWLVFGDDSRVVVVAAYVGATIGFVLGWWPFARWAKRKRDRARGVIRDGVLCEAKVATGLADRVASVAVQLAMRGGMHWERVAFEHDGKTYSCVAPFPSRPAVGTVAHVLFAPGAKYALAFSPAGAAYPTKPSART